MFGKSNKTARQAVCAAPQPDQAQVIATEPVPVEEPVMQIDEPQSMDTSEDKFKTVDPFSVVAPPISSVVDIDAGEEGSTIHVSEYVKDVYDYLHSIEVCISCGKNFMIYLLLRKQKYSNTFFSFVPRQILLLIHNIWADRTILMEK